MTLIQKYQTVDAIYAAMPEVDAKPAVLKKLETGEADARMSHHLATIITNAPLAFDPKENLCRPAKPEPFVVVCPMRVEINLTFVCSVTS